MIEQQKHEYYPVQCEKNIVYDYDTELKDEKCCLFSVFTLINNYSD